MMLSVAPDFAEDGAAIQVVCEVLHVGEWVPVWCCDGVEAAVVAAWPPGAVFLGHHVQGRRPGRVGPTDYTCFLEFCELGLGDAQLVRRQAAGLGEHRAVSAGVDGVLYAVCRRWCERF